MKNSKKYLSKISSVLEMVIGYLLTICLLVGALGAFGYLVAFCIGGETASNICSFLYNKFYLCLIYISTSTTVLCFLLLYLRGDAKWKNPIKYWKEYFISKKSRKI